MSDWLRAFSQSGVEMVYSIQSPSGLGASDPNDRMVWTSMNVTGRGF
jgi:hypothetical protein